MATSVPVTHYRNEFVAGFEARQSVTRNTVTTEAMVNGKEAVFLIVNSNREAVTRGPNGLIPAAVDDQSQVTVQLKELHDLVQRTRFNIFTDQGDQRRIMQMGGQAVINRSIDGEIFTALTAATVNLGAASAMSTTVVGKVITKLANAKVPRDGNLYGAVTPATWAELLTITSFASSDYVPDRPVVEGMPSPTMLKNWMGIKWYVPEVDLPGQGTSTATNFFYHRSAVGHALNRAGINVFGGYAEEQDYYWSRPSLDQGAKRLLNGGVVKHVQDDTTLS